MPFDLNQYCTKKANENNTTVQQEKYDILKKVFNRAAEERGEREPSGDRKSTKRKDEHYFDEEEGHVNLLGVRGMKNGKVEEDDITDYDDTMFVISKDEKGKKNVKEFRLATDTRQYGREKKKASAYLVWGQHRYRLGNHRGDKLDHVDLGTVNIVLDEDGFVDKEETRKKSTHEKLSFKNLGEDKPHDFNSKGIQYRALVPDTKKQSAVCLRDYNGNRELDENVHYKSWREDGEKEAQFKKDVVDDEELEYEGYAHVGGLNIHHSPWREKSYTDGCQSIPGWEEYKEFIKEIEKDSSIKGTNNNELVEHEGGDGKTTEDEARPVIYTLVKGTFVEAVAKGEEVSGGGVNDEGNKTTSRLALPFTSPDEEPFAFNTVDNYYTESEEGPGGWYPIGANQTWHNGIHLTRSRHQVVRAVAPGKIVAAKLPHNDELAGYRFGSPGFILMKHQIQVPTQPDTLAYLNQLCVFEDNPARPSEQNGHLHKGCLVETLGESHMKFYPRDTFPYADELPEVVGSSGTRTVGLIWHKVRHPERAGKTSNDTGWVAGASDDVFQEVPLRYRKAKIVIEEDPDKDPRGLNCRSSPDSDTNNVIGVIPKGTEVTLYTEGYQGTKWKPVRAPDQDVPFGWIYTGPKGSQERVQKLDEVPPETKEFYSLYMNAAAEEQTESGEAIPWLEDYYPYLSDEGPADDVGIARLKEATDCYAEPPQDKQMTVDRTRRPKNSLLAFESRSGELPERSGWEHVVWYDGEADDLKTGFVERNALESLSGSGYETGRIEWDEDDGGLNSRSTPELPDGNHNVLGSIPHGTLVKLYESGYNDGSRIWKAVRAEEEGVPLGWVVTMGSSGKELVSVPEDIKQTARKLEQGKLVKPNVSVSAGEPVANVGLIHPRRWLEDGSPQYGVHLEIFSTENVFNEEHMEAGRWKMVEAKTSRDVVCPSEKTFQRIAERVEDDTMSKMLARLGWGGSNATNRKEMAELREQLEENLPALRRLITHNTSYWAIDWEQVATHNQEWANTFTFSEDDAREARHYSWWQQCGDLGLPDDALVYHYHPVTVLDYLHKQLPQPGGQLPQPGGLNLKAKMKLVRVVASFESGSNSYTACNRDYEFKGYFDLPKGWYKDDTKAKPDKINPLVDYSKYSNDPRHVGLSFGLIQFTQEGPLGELVALMHETDPAKFAEVFGPHHEELLNTLQKTGGYTTSEEEVFDNTGKSMGTKEVRRKPSVQPVGGHELWEDYWVERFKKAGRVEAFQRCQEELAVEKYLDPLLEELKGRRVSEKSLCCLYDRSVNEGVGGARERYLKPFKKASDERAFWKKMAKKKGGDIGERLKIITESSELSWDTRYDI